MSAYLSMLAIRGQIGILFIATTFIIFRAMWFPVSQANPTKIMSTCTTLHMVAASIFLYADLALRTVLSTVHINIYSNLYQKSSTECIWLYKKSITRVWNIKKRDTKLYIKYISSLFYHYMIKDKQILFNKHDNFSFTLVWALM